MFKKKEKRFRIKDEQTLGLGGVYVIVDTITGVNYLSSGAISPSGITPLLDKNGDVVIDKLSESDS